MAQNLYRLICLVVEIGGDVLRKYMKDSWQKLGYTSLHDLLLKEIHLMYHCYCPRHKCCCGFQDRFSGRSLTTTQWEKLYGPCPTRGPCKGCQPHGRQHPCQFNVRSSLKLDDIDVTIACLVIFNVLKLTQHEQDVKQIREMRNFVAHFPSTTMDDITFEQQWTKTTNSILQLAKAIPSLSNKTIESEIEGLKVRSLDGSECDRLHKVLKTFTDQDRLLQDIADDVEHVKGQQNQMDQGIQTMIHKLGEHTVHIDSKTLDILGGVKHIKGQLDKKDQEEQIKKQRLEDNTEHIQSITSHIADGVESMKGQMDHMDLDLQTTKRKVEELVQECKKKQRTGRDPTIERQIANTKLNLDNHKNTLYVSNSAAEKVAYERLVQNHCVTLSGRGGFGKTSLAKHLMVKLCEEKQTYTALIVQRPEDFDVIHGEDNLVIFVDDPFGKTNTDKTALDQWGKKFDMMMPFCNEGNVYIIIGCRTSIMKECDDTLRKCRLFQKPVDMSSEFKFSTTEKLNMLKAYCNQHKVVIWDKENEQSNNSSGSNQISIIKLPTVTSRGKKMISENTLKEISKSDPFSGFPQICYMFFYQDSLFRQGLYVFTHTDKIMDREISDLRKHAPIQYFTLVLMLLEGGEIDLHGIKKGKIKQLSECLGQVYPIPDITDCLTNDISKVYVEEVDGTVSFEKRYKFTHESILESVLQSFCYRYPGVFLELAHIDIIAEFARPCGYQPRQDEICVELPAIYHQLLAKRLVMKDDLNFITKNQSVSNESFVEHLLNELEIKDLPRGDICEFDDGDYIITLNRTKYTDDNATDRDTNFADLLYYGVLCDRYCLVKGICQRYTNYKQMYSDDTSQQSLSKPKLYVKSFLYALDYMLRKGQINDVQELLKCSGLDLNKHVHNSGKHCTADLKSDADIYDADSKVLLPIRSAVDQELQSLVLFCLESISIKVLDSMVEELLYCCCKQNWFDVLDKIFGNYKDVLLKKGKSPSTFMLNSARYKHRDVVLYLLKYDVDVNTTDEENMSIIDYCCKYDWVDVLDEIYKKYEDVFFHRDNSPSSFISHAAKNKSKNTVDYLLKYNVDFVVTDEVGNTLCHYCSKHGWKNEVLICVKSFTEVVNLKNKDGMTPLLLAAQSGHQDIVLELLHRGADPSVQDNNGNTLSHYCAVCVMVEVFNKLPTNTNIWNYRNKHGFSPLHISFCCGSQKVGELLHNQNENVQCGKLSPLYLACLGLITFYNDDLESFLCKVIGINVEFYKQKQPTGPRFQIGLLNGRPIHDDEDIITGYISLFEYIIRHKYDHIERFCEPLDQNGYTLMHVALLTSTYIFHFRFPPDFIDWIESNYNQAIHVRNKTQLPTILHIAAYVGDFETFEQMYELGVKCQDGDLSLTETSQLGKQHSSRTWHSDSGWVYGQGECLLKGSAIPYTVHFSWKIEYDKIITFCSDNSIL